MKKFTLGEVEIKLAQLLQRVTGFDGEIRPELNLVEDIGLTSLVFIELMVELEEAFDMRFPDEFLITNDTYTVKTLLDVILENDE